MVWLGRLIRPYHGKVHHVDVFIGPWSELKAGEPADQPDERAFPLDGIVKVIYVVGNLGPFMKSRPTGLSQGPSMIQALRCVLIGESSTVLGGVGTLHGGGPIRDPRTWVAGQHHRLRPEELTVNP